MIYLLCQTVHKYESSKPSGKMARLGMRNSGVAIESSYIYMYSHWIAFHSVVVLRFLRTNASILLKLQFTMYPFLAHRAACSIILYSYKVLKH